MGLESQYLYEDWNSLDMVNLECGKSAIRAVHARDLPSRFLEERVVLPQRSLLRI